MTLQGIGRASEEDSTLCRARAALDNKGWARFLDGAHALRPEVSHARRQLWQARSELSVGSEGVILRGHMIVIPESLQKRVLALAHVGHQGMSKTKARLRAKVWFPAMDQMVEELTRQCHACTITGGDPAPAPVITEEPSTVPWTHLSIDFGSFPDGRQLLVLIDSFSKFPVTEVVASTAFPHVQKALDKIFAIMDLPEEIKSDNGPPFQGQEFRAYLENKEIRHRKITPLWPQANGVVERLIRTINRALRIAVDREEDPEKALDQFLAIYRQTPHSTTKCAPAHLLFKRAPRDVIPVDPTWQPPERDGEAVQTRRETTNRKASEVRGAKSSPLRVGDSVVIRDRHPGWQFRTPYESEVCIVSDVKGTMITARRGQQSVTRNITCFKRAADPGNISEEYPSWEPGFDPPASPNPGHTGPESLAPASQGSATRNRTECQNTVAQPAAYDTAGAEASPRVRSRRYDLRPNPGPSQWLKDFVRATP